MTSDIWQNLPRGLNARTLKTLASDTSMDLLASLLSDFDQELGTHFEQVKALFNDKDLGELAEILHTVKGLAATFGNDTLHQMAFEVEQSAKERKIAEVERQMENLNTAFESAISDTKIVLQLLEDSKDNLPNAN